MGLENEKIGEEDIREALFPVPSQIQEVNDIMEQTLGGSFDINILIEEVRAHYTRRLSLKPTTIQHMLRSYWVSPTIKH